MEFWGVEVKSGQPFDVKIGEGSHLNLTQACLGETYQKTRESVIVNIIVNGKKLLLAALDPEWVPTEILNMVFFKNFQISLSSTNGSVYLYGTIQEEEKTRKEEGNKVEEESPARDHPLSLSESDTNSMDDDDDEDSEEEEDEEEETTKKEDETSAAL